ncbi:MAG: leucine-rich repeat domain-containing protein [Chitinispirillia bacterium]
MTNNNLTSLPSEIWNLKTLTYLQLNNNNLTELPSMIINLNRLKIFELRNNKLKELPEEIKDLTKLTWFVLSGNQLTSLPTGIGNLTKLELFTIDHNKLSSLPKSISSISPETLKLGYNRLDPNKLSPDIVHWANTHDPDWRDTQNSVPKAVSIDLEEINLDVQQFLLNQNNTDVLIDYFLPFSGTIIGSVIDSKGRLITTITDGYSQTGIHSIKWNFNQHSNGIYYIQIFTNSKTSVHKICFTK